MRNFNGNYSGKDIVLDEGFESNITKINVVETLTFTAFIEGLAYTGIPCFVRDNELKIERGLLRPLMTHFVKFANQIGELVPINAIADSPKGVRIVDGNQGESSWDEESGLFTVKVVLNFISLKKAIDSNTLAMAVYEMSKDNQFKLDRQLVAFTIDDKRFTCPKGCESSLLSETEWVLYVRDNEWRTNEDGSCYFPTPAYKTILQQNCPKISPDTLEKIRAHQRKYLKLHGTTNEVAVAAKNKPAFNNQAKGKK